MMNENEIINFIKKYAETSINADNEDFLVCDYAAGNIDDAYALGVDHGEVFFARSILKKIKDLDKN